MVKEIPEAIGYDTGIWTASLACEIVHNRFGVKYSLQNMQRLLGKLGLSFKLPQKKLKRADPAKQQEWLDVTLPGIIEKVVWENGVMLHEYEASSGISGTVSRSWIEKREFSEVMTEGSSESVKVFGAVSIEENPRFHFRIAEVFNALVF